ncbi:hypothetical protein NW755_014339 [Fusarium falciforme]|uniref:Epoxide hydrolase n=1 Tax=Fusarium falciforme TaxID=195108 RepID=A0A9W8UUP5_9HYPO|nr:hypothetical protein NW755_014339 [Fusarium falciforme]
MYAASDGYPYSNEEIITNTMLLWVQEPFGHLRIYREISKPESSVYPKTDVPTGVVQWGAVNGPFPDLVQWPFTPKDWIERTSRLVYFKRYEFGGHYPAISYPDLWAESVGEFFSAL